MRGSSMNSFERKLRTRLVSHPQMWHAFLANPTTETVRTVISCHLFDSPRSNLATIINTLLPLWENEACEGNESLAELIHYLEEFKLSAIPQEEDPLRPNLLRLRILASTPGIFPFSPTYIQENLVRFLESSDCLADLPEFQAIAFSRQEIEPLSSDLSVYHLSPHSRRFVQNLYYAERCEAVLSILAYIAKNYPLLGTCRQAYALMLSLDKPEIWSHHPFSLRLIANRYWEYRLQEDGY
ncbi:hypothetical protein JCM15765_05230 [Paradesulfitobacterium aromaticivorans]